MVPYSENLVALLYLLMRDEVVPGAVARIVTDIEQVSDRTRPAFLFTNKHLEAYARELAGRLS